MGRYSLICARCFEKKVLIIARVYAEVKNDRICEFLFSQEIGVLLYRVALLFFFSLLTFHYSLVV